MSQRTGIDARGHDEGNNLLKTNVLHLSDLHFGGDWDETEVAKRKMALASLVDEISKLPDAWRPNVVAISGDIAWGGKRADFDKAAVWIDQLLDVAGLAYSDVVLCAGNHDIDRKVSRTYARPRNASEADQILRSPIATHYESAFNEFSEFCKRKSIPLLKFGSSQSSLIGSMEHRGLRFISVNSSWFCKDESDKGNLWVGLEHLRLMDGSGQFPVVANATDSIPTICLLHHPKEWLHEEEQHAYGSRPNTFDFIAKRCHVLLTGHTHGELREADRIAGSAWHFTAGAAYASASHFNSFKLIQLSDAELQYRSFEFDPRASSSPWSEREIGEATLPF